MKEKFESIINRHMPNGKTLQDSERQLLSEDRFKANDIFYLLLGNNLEANDEQKILETLKDLIPCNLIIDDWMLRTLSKNLLIDCLDHLFREGFAINTTDDSGENIIFKMLETSRFNFSDKNFELFKSAFERLINLEVSYKITNEAGQNILHKAVKSGVSNSFLTYISNLDLDINLQDNAGYTPLHFAVENLSYEQVSILIANGALASKSLKTISYNVENTDVPTPIGYTPLELYLNLAPEGAEYCDKRIIDLLK